ncbi:DUF4381 domain-containing protein [Stenotrophomonas sp.]|uniref:DUF4381 domain-containing protein n=1 Tax=Stenotrophomonas sp. TaxID=69392 RepID=UPI0028B0D879|nr:DUF4381 domain-containing protein [Stenotrophomonas sp.]
MSSQLPLRDVHLPAAPSVWPPAPGWWLLIAGVLLVLGAYLLWMWLRRRRRQRWLALFDAQLQATAAGPERLAAASELLRRAARRVDANAVSLQGEPWLRFLDGAKGRDFSEGDGRVLLEGGFRPQLDAALVERACAVARARFITLMAGTR